MGTLRSAVASMLGVLVMLAVFLVPGVARADYATPALAYSACQSYLAGNFPTATGKQCLDDPANKKVAAWANGFLQQYFNYTGTLSCSGSTAQSGAFAGKLGAGSPMCQAVTDKQGCGSTFTPDSPSFMNRAGTQWATHGTYNPTGATCTPGQVSAAPPTVAAKSCGGSSCYDSSSDKYCAVSGGVQVCVSGSTARSSTGGCSSVGDSALCAGATSVPQPSPPPTSPISDPASEIKGSDKYTTANGSTGANQTTTVNAYGAGSSTPSSGQGTGDDGPGTASKGDGTTSGGGGDCNTPPFVNGSGGMAAIAYQTWRTRCAMEGQQGGTGTGASVGTLYTPSGETSQSVVADFQSKLQNAPIANAASGFFNVGSVGGSCPTWTLAATEWNPQLTFDFFCRPEAGDMLDMAKVIILITCAYCAWVIAMGDS